MSILLQGILVFNLIFHVITSPLFLWSNHELPSDFELENLINFVSSNSIIIFSPVKFSHEDLSFSKANEKWVLYLKDKLLDIHKSKYYSESCQKESLISLKAISQNMDLKNINELNLNDKIYRIDLPRIMDVKENLTDIIENTLALLEGKGHNYIAVLANLEDVIKEGTNENLKITNKVNTRSVRAVANEVGNSTAPNGHFINGTCVYVYLKNATFHVGRPKKPHIVETFSLQNSTINILEPPDCQNQRSQQMLISFSNLPQGLTDLNIHFSFVKNRWNYWRMSNLTAKFAVQTANNKLNNDNASFHISKEVGTYTNWSYVCDEMGMTERPKPKDKNYTVLYFDDYQEIERNYTFVQVKILEFFVTQIQAFGVRNNSFGRPSDCTGFFSPALWMGLFSSGVLISVLAFGLSVLLSTKTMDRFDNPKMADALNLAGGSN